MHKIEMLLYGNKQNLSSGEAGHEVSVSVTPENRLRNRFKNINTCKFMNKKLFLF